MDHAKSWHAKYSTKPLCKQASALVTLLLLNCLVSPVSGQLQQQQQQQKGGALHLPTSVDQQDDT